MSLSPLFTYCNNHETMIRTVKLSIKRTLAFNPSLQVASFRSFSSSLCMNDKNKKSDAKIKSTSALKKPHYDFKYIVANADKYLESAKLRNMTTKGVEDIQSTYEPYQKARNQLNHLQAQRKQLESVFTASFGKNKGSSKEQNQQKPPIDIKEAKEKLNILKTEAKELSDKISDYEQTLMIAGDLVPNLISPDSFVPEPQTVEILNDNNGSRPRLPDDFDHVAIGKKLGLIELEAASKVSGSSWYYLTGDGALLEQALVSYAMSKARNHGFYPVIPPSIVRREVAGGCGFKPRDQNGEQQIYNLENSDLCLTGTAEIPLAGLYCDSVLEFPKEGPNKGVKKVVGVSRSYRAEAGARGRDTKGLYRVHEFTKVELFAWADSLERSESVLSEILALEKEMISELGLTARVLNMSPDELGAPAYKKYDIEAWMPGRQDWGELTSTSNCTDFQARRMHTKYRNEEGKLVFVQTLNGTAMAVPRVIVAILETFYESDQNRVKIPKVLQKWMDDREYITENHQL